MLLNHNGDRARGEEEEEDSCIEKTKGWKKICFSVLVICVGLGFFNVYFQNLSLPNSTVLKHDLLSPIQCQTLVTW